MVPVCDRELSRAWRKHFRAYESLEPVLSHSKYLLLYYAVECRMKERLLRYYRVRSYNELPDEAKIGHQINIGLKLLRAPAFIRRVPSIVTKDAGKTRVHDHELHEAWRYGKSFDQKNESEIVTVLMEIMDWLESD